MNMVSYLLSTASHHAQHSSKLRLFLLESLQTDDDNGWSSEYIKLFCSLNMVFALATVPFIIFIQHFWLAEFLKAVINCDALGLFCHCNVFHIINSDSFVNTREMNLKLTVEVCVPIQTKSEIFLAGIRLSGSIEAHIVLYSKVLQHVENSFCRAEWQSLALLINFLDFKLIWKFCLLELLFIQIL